MNELCRKELANYVLNNRVSISDRLNEVKLDNLSNIFEGKTLIDLIKGYMKLFDEVEEKFYNNEKIMQIIENNIIKNQTDDYEIRFKFEMTFKDIEKNKKNSKKESKSDGIEVSDYTKKQNKSILSKYIQDIFAVTNLEIDRIFDENTIESSHGSVNLFANKGYTQVFLSHAYLDKLYTFLLFLFMLDHDIFLYIDWMHNGKVNCGIELKSILADAIDNSEQLLFLRSLNSELRIPGGGVRQWCSWEIGLFYSNDREKFFLNIGEDYSDSNIFYDNFRNITRIQGRLF